MILKKGDKNKEVKEIQNILASNGYDIGTVDGIFGTKTETAVKKLQQSVKIQESGIIGDWLYNYIIKLPTVKKIKTITITAGHNNKDPGAVNGNRTEAQIVTEMRNYIASILRGMGYKVLTDGEGDVNNSLSEAVKLISPADLAIELHLNAASNKTAGGVEALAGVKYKDFCKNLCGHIAKVMGNKVRGSDGGWKSETSGQHTRLAFVSNGGIILETFFISNDLELSTYDKNKKEICEAIVKAIIEYF